jgi:hypothetical protein
MRKAVLMIVLEDTHWPLVVVGECCQSVDCATLARARARWRSLEPRLAVFVVPGAGLQALSSLDRIVGWLRRQPVEAALCRIVAWVIPDNDVRTSVVSLLDAHDHVAFSGASATFRTVDAALAWITDRANTATMPA